MEIAIVVACLAGSIALALRVAKLLLAGVLLLGRMRAHPPEAIPRAQQ